MRSSPLPLALSIGLLSAPACVSSAPTEPIITHVDELPLPPAGAEGFGLDGRPLLRPVMDPALLAEREAQLEDARRAFAERPEDPEAWIWLGRRTAYLNRYAEALALFEAGAARFPGDARFYRHIGHRLISLRSFVGAQLVLAHAAALARGLPDEVEPAGLPNARGIELSTRDQEIYYHLALARYLVSDFDGAAEAWEQCLSFANNDDARLAAAAWLYAALRRAGRHDEARAAVAWVTRDIDVVEYHGYHDLCLVYAGLLDAEERLAALEASPTDAVNDATVGYGLANWLHVEGQEQRARELLQRLAASPTWMAFGAIAAEADLEAARSPAASPLRFVID